MSATTDTMLGTETTIPLSTVETAADGSVIDPEVPAVWSVDDSTVLTLNDQSDGSTLAVRVSKSAGQATVTATVTNPDGSVQAGTIALTVDAVGGGAVDVADVEIVPGVHS